MVLRRTLTDAQWSRIKDLVPGKEGDRGRTGEDNRLFVDAVLWVLRTDASWRELPRELGNWNSVYVRFARWSRNGIWESLFEALAEDPAFETVMTHAAIIRSAGLERGRTGDPSGDRAPARRSKSDNPHRGRRTMERLVHVAGEAA